MKFGLLFVLFMLAGGNVANAYKTYAVYAPVHIQKGYPYAIDIELLGKVMNPIDFEIDLISKSEARSSRVQLSPETRNYTRVELEPFPLDHEDRGFTDLFISENGSFGGIYVTSRFHGPTFAPGDHNNVSIAIETDKQIYKPRQTVKFRAVVFTRNLLPYNGTVSYKVEDPKGNIILKESNAQLTHGVVGDEFKLGRYSELGSWKITYTAKGTVKTREITVKDYKLAKWSVGLKIDKPNSKSTGITGVLSAEYTFKQPVRGTALIQIYGWYGDYEPITIHIPEFTGSESVNIDADTLRQRLNIDKVLDDYTLIFHANVTNNSTGETYQSQETFEVKEPRARFVGKAGVVIPGLPYIQQVDISELVEIPFRDHQNVELEMVMSMDREDIYSNPGDILDREEEKEVFSVTAKPNGIVTFQAEIKNDDDYKVAAFRLKVAGQSSYIHAWTRFVETPPSNKLIKMIPERNVLAHGDVAVFNVYTTHHPDYFRFMVSNQKRILKSEVFRPASLTISDIYFAFNYTFKVGKEYSPEVVVVVSFVSNEPTTSFVTDSVTVQIPYALDNKVSMKASSYMVAVGSQVSIQVEADPGSFVGLTGVDRSVRLSHTDGAITSDKIIQAIKKEEDQLLNCYYVGPEDLLSAGIKVLSEDMIVEMTDDLLCRNLLYSVECDGPGCHGYNVFGIDEPINRAPPPPTETRRYFPETWIWTDGTTGDDGTITFNYTVPDTITTWELTSFAISHHEGVGAVDGVSQITAFQNFFISLDLPPSVVRGETLRMKAIVFNYFDQDVFATVRLADNEWYDIIASEDTTADPGIRTMTLPSKDSASVIFPVEFTKAGTARILIGVRSSLAADQVERTLQVKPAGIPVVISRSDVIERTDENEPESLLQFNVDIPDDAEEESSYVKFTLSGSVIANALGNLGNLLALPAGCGEQNMLNFAPDVYISLFLENSDQMTDRTRAKSKDHIRKGYHNELRYQHDDGSFSAFGPSDQFGSTWLTAFVVKIFKAASELDADLIEETQIQKAVWYIWFRQNFDGSFGELGYVLDTDMQGGVNGNKTTAAYVLIALAEDGKFEEDEITNFVVKKAQRYLERNILAMDDMYTLSIIGYALSLVDSAYAESVLTIIDSMATTEGNLKYWKKRESGASKCLNTEFYCHYNTESTSSSIEMTSYVLLTYVKQGRISETQPIVRWLVTQRGSFGGYHSTQDTVIAIQALSAVAGVLTSRDLEINVAHDGKPDFHASFQLNEDNAIVLQMAELPNVVGSISVSATGRGFADVQVTVGYNLPIRPRSDEPFNLDIKFKKPGENLILKICSSVNENRSEVINGTGMYVVTFKLPSGYTIDDQKATKQNKQAKMVELVGEEVTAYFNELRRRRRVCVELELMKFADVEGVKPKVLQSYDYYKPELSAMRLLTIPQGQECPCCEDNSTEPCCSCEEEVYEPPADSYCDTEAYPCPDFVDGLFYDRSSHIAELTEIYQDNNTCRAPEGGGDSRMFVGLPASYLDGVNQYIECNSESFESMLRSNEGWTFSIAVYPTELNKRNYYSIISISSVNATRPYVYLAKKSGSNQYWMRIFHDGRQLIVRFIYTRHIPVKRWSLITARLIRGKPSVFVNGRKVGSYSKRTYHVTPIRGPVTLRVGKSPAVGTNKGNFKGLLASLDVWTRPLTDIQIMAHYDYWKSSINHVNPTLDLAKVHHLVPQSIRKCFSRAYTASELKSRSGDLRTDCD